jgi:hypothetical protein
MAADCRPLAFAPEIGAMRGPSCFQCQACTHQAAGFLLVPDVLPLVLGRQVDDAFVDFVKQSIQVHTCSTIVDGRPLAAGSSAATWRAISSATLFVAFVHGSAGWHIF